MNIHERIAYQKINPAKAFIAAVSVSLCTLSATVIFAWHHHEKIAQIHLTKMAFNTAICIASLGVILIFLLLKKPIAIKFCAAVIGVISFLTLLELFSTIQLNINYWFVSKTQAEIVNGISMSPTSAVCLLIISAAVLLSTFKAKRRLIPIVILNFITLTITFIALLGYGIGVVPAFVWLGVQMAPHTAVCLSLFCIAFITYIRNAAFEAFDQLNFFNRIVTGFGFMAVLVVAIGSVAFTQIHTVSAITHQLYENPLQIHNAAQRIKNEISSINRQLKNIAIQRELPESLDIPQQFEIVETRLRNDIDLIHRKDATLSDMIENLDKKYDAWKKYTFLSWQIATDRNFDAYVARTSYEGQELVVELEKILQDISLHAQHTIGELNKSVSSTEEDAKQLVVVIVTGFLIIGLIVSSFITRSITHQIYRLRRSMLAIAQGNLNEPIPFLKQTQEIGDMARALKVFHASFEARRELEARLMQVIEAMPNGVIVSDEAGTIEIVNAQTENIFGCDRSDILGHSVKKFIPHQADNINNAESNFSNFASQFIGARSELCGIRHGKEFPLEIGLAPVTTKEGTKILASIIDITERRKAATALNESRERLELTTRINQIGVWEYLDGKVFWDDTMFEIYGRNKHYFTHDYAAWKQCIHPNDMQKAENEFKESISNLTPYFCKFRIIQPDGTIKHVRANAKIERTEDDKVRMLGTNIDITREELVINQLHNLEILRSAIVESSEDAIISKSPTGIITTWNLGATNIFGFSAAEAIGKPIKELIFPSDLIHEEEMLLMQVRAGSVIKHYETRRRCKDGRIINVSITLSPIKDTDENIIGISAIKRDITEAIETANTLKARTSALEQTNQELERSNKELETFAYVASHDLKSPLRGIAQLSSWIEEDLAENETASVVEHTHLLRNRIQRMEKLLDDLLIFYRAGKLEGAMIDIDVNQMAKDVFDIQNNKLGIVLEILNPLPVFSTLSTPFELVIRNLFSNAIKHHDRQNGKIRISSRDIDHNFIEFTVSDDGPGIPEKFHDRIFGMFQTLKPRDELEGSGMGLALIKKIVETYGGYIKLTSQDRGSCFYFSWPQTIRRRQEND